MGSRSGSVDPAILLYLLREKGVTADRLDTMLSKESGLKGLSGISGDMREIAAVITHSNNDNSTERARASIALGIYIHRLRGGKPRRLERRL